MFFHDFFLTSFTFAQTATKTDEKKTASPVQECSLSLFTAHHASGLSIGSLALKSNRL